MTEDARVHPARFPWFGQEVDPGSGSGQTVGGLLRNLEMALEYYESGEGLAPDPSLVARGALDDVRRAMRTGQHHLDEWWEARRREAEEAEDEAARLRETR